MFRSAIARAAPRVAAAAARRTIVSVPRVNIAAKGLAQSAFSAPKAASVSAVRFYSAAAGLEREEVESRILSLLQGLDKVDAAQLKATSHFANDLGLDSLDTVEVVMAIEEEFSIEIPDKDADSIHSVDQAVEYILHEPHAH
ncbi:acyl carrier protein [Ophiostoma piceae UAMH 11346]|uniref:Acyl carrier protein n=1 Tax=Ophiostoma piceae (strain UAMH 11346) TaxID=1262450 RepID=S3BY23_OPHP1|nr:acyl carrier protein [Ophiostoma piceae UAMH 11346]